MTDLEHYRLTRSTAPDHRASISGRALFWLGVANVLIVIAAVATMA